MLFQTEINAIPVEAYFSEENTRTIFLPLLRELQQMAQKKGRRVVAFLAAPPGAGKSTLIEYLRMLSETVEGLTPITPIGMDGFHRYQEYLLTHTVQIRGEEVPMVTIKGAPITFDLEKMREKIAEVAAGVNCGWPRYDRLLHNPIEDAMQVCGSIVLIEGNYLLLDAPGWRELRAYADYTIQITAEPELLRARLLDRRIKTGVDAASAAEFVDRSDMENVRLCLSGMQAADLMLKLKPDGTFAFCES